MISAFKHIRLSGYNLTPIQSAAWDNSSTLRLGFGNSGLAYYSELTGISGYLKSLIDVGNADVNSVNNLSGNIYITGGDGITIDVNSTLGEIKVVGNSGYFQALSNEVSSNLATTGSTLYNLLIGFSGGLDLNFASQAEFSALSGNLIQTGSILDSKINSLSGYVDAEEVLIRADIASTGNILNNRINSLSGYVNSQDIIFSGQTFNTGSRLDSKINSLSGYVNSRDSLFSGQTASTGSILSSRINSLSGYVNSQNTLFSGQIASTGSILDNKINNYSGWANATYVAKSSQQVFTKELTPLNLDAYAIMYPVAFVGIPKIQATLEVPGEVMYNLSVRSVGSDGYTGVLSDNIAESPVYIHTFASTQN
jgi:hypothetical protein